MFGARHYDLNCRITQANSTNRYNKTQPIGIYFVVNYPLRMAVAENQKKLFGFLKNQLPTNS